MRALIQRVSQASVSIAGSPYSNIGPGLLILLGIEREDDSEDLTWLSNKIVQMRLFEDSEGKMNKSIMDVSGELLIVSQFTLYASTKKGNRPSFIKSAKPAHALPIYHQFIEQCALHVPVSTGEFGAMMNVSLINDGPVTIWLDSKRRE